MLIFKTNIFNQLVENGIVLSKALKYMSKHSIILSTGVIKMYKVVSFLTTLDSGKKITVYGIESKEAKYCDLGTNRKSIKKLCRLCNKYKIKEPQLKYIIEDFLCSDAGLPSIFTR